MTAEDIIDLFGSHQPVTLRRMFGGHGIYADGVIFGIESDGEIFLKVDDESRAFFVALGCGPFTYEKKVGEQSIMSYYRLPAEAYDDEALLVACLRQALGAARRAGVKAQAKPKKINAR
jgi:DNA transformation protein